MSSLQNKIDAAMEWCEYSTHPQHKMSALAFDGKILIAAGANSLKTHPKAKTFGNHLHAELALIIVRSGYPDYLTGTTVIVARRKKSGAPGNSKPCSVCWAALVASKVKKVIYYSEEEKKWKTETL